MTLFNLNSVVNSPNRYDTTQIIQRWVHTEPDFFKPGAYLGYGNIVYLLQKGGLTLNGLKVLECGPLEGHHTRQLSQAGCDVVAIEGKPYNYIKCLVNRELMPHKGQFLLGNFVQHLAETNVVYDLIVANGVLYHQVSPIRFIRFVCEKSHYLWLGSCYFLENTYPSLSEMSNINHGLFLNGEKTTFSVDGKEIVAYQHQYKAPKPVANSIGGIDNSIGFLFTIDDILWLVQHFGHEIQWYQTPPHSPGIVCHILSKRA